jgi:3-(3-hydroxy-phenyl)propionate hydroxylase
MSERHPVIIAGAGPTGLMCALALTRQGIPVALFEAEPTLTLDLRAGVFHPPTLEMMAPYGITARMLETGIKVRYWQIRNRPGDLIAEFDLNLLADETPYPFRLHLEQHKLTPIQLDILKAEGGAEVHFGHRVTGFTQNADSVSVTVENEDGTRTIDASWLVGADGGRSVVRKETGVAFEGFTWPGLFVVVSTPHDFARHGFALNCYIADPVEWGALFKAPDNGPPGLWRLAFPTNAEESDEVLRPERVEAVLQHVVAKLEPYEVRYKSAYRVHQRVAADFRVGRVLLAGDAAHLNNPLGGFGLNGGIHDAVNLCDKLGRLWRGEGGPELLDRYVRQRRAATIEQVQAMSIRNKQMLEERDPALLRARLQEMMAVARDPVRAKQHLLHTSMISGVRRAEQVQ